MTEEKRFNAFVGELAKLSKRYGIVIHSTGGIDIFEPQEIERVVYSTDHTSGDLRNRVIFKEKENEV